MIDLKEIIRYYPTELRRSEFYEQMVKEYFHFHMLRFLFSAKHAEKINFLGGSALRYVYGIKRFSEDLDFDCINLDRNQFIEMTDHVVRELNKMNIKSEVADSEKDKRLFAFRRVIVFPELKFELGLSRHKEAKFFIKIEAEPQNYLYQHQIKILNGFEVVIPVRIVPVEVIFATKIATAIKRKKDRDFFDFIFLSSFSRPDFGYLETKLGIKNTVQLKEELYNAAISKKLDSRKLFDCEHMLFNQGDRQKISNFITYIKSFDFSVWE